MKRVNSTDVTRLQLQAKLLNQMREKLAITPGTPMAAMNAVWVSAQIVRTLKDIDAIKRR